MNKSDDIFFNAHHAPVGAFASFTLGFPGAKGGLGLELEGPANESLFVGLEKSAGEGFEALPFFASSVDSLRRFDVSAGAEIKQEKVRPFDSKKISRTFGPGTDTWAAGDLTFSVYSAPKAVPDPRKAGKAELMRALVPAIFAEINVDNSRCKKPRKVFFGYKGSNVKRFSYRDKVRLPGDKTEYPGGVSFTHDMGVGNCVSRPGFSAYELFALDGCFSHMTHEQLVNWVLCGVSYFHHTGDTAWLKKNLRTFRQCLTSLVNRDHPDPAQRDGVMSADSSRCLGGAEITTYDSLDISLGQARNNLYLAVKSWAAYLGLRLVFAKVGDVRLERTASRQAGLCARTICANMREDGFIPAVMGENNESAIIPVIEGLVFPLCWGLKPLRGKGGEFAFLREALARHLNTVPVKGTCKFADGGWKLSSTNDNSWLSKIYLCQHVAREVFGLGPDPAADEAHRHWLLDPENSYFAWSDQMVAGKARGSKYYPRGVTAWLWLSGKRYPPRIHPTHDN